jgi:hypothetical protein
MLGGHDWLFHSVHKPRPSAAQRVHRLAEDHLARIRSRLAKEDQVACDVYGEFRRQSNIDVTNSMTPVRTPSPAR